MPLSYVNVFYQFHLEKLDLIGKSFRMWLHNAAMLKQKLAYFSGKKDFKQSLPYIQNKRQLYKLCQHILHSQNNSVFVKNFHILEAMHMIMAAKFRPFNVVQIPNNQNKCVQVLGAKLATWVKLPVHTLLVNLHKQLLHNDSSCLNVINPPEHNFWIQFICKMVEMCLEDFHNWMSASGWTIIILWQFCVNDCYLVFVQ